MFELAERLLALRDEKTQTEARLKKVNSLIEETEFRLSDEMALNEIQNFTRAGITFFLTAKTRASAVAEIKDQLFSALTEKGFGDLVYQTVNANSLSAFVKEQIAENNSTLPDWLDGLVHVYEKITVGVRKAAK